MKVIHLLATDKFSGAENVACQIINVSKEEKNIEVYYCSLKGEIEDTLKEKEINFIGLKKFSLKEINKVINEYKPDVIHVHDYKASLLVAVSRFKGKIISHLHNNCPDVTSWTIKSILYSLVIKRFDHIVGVSQKVYDEAIFKNKMKNKFTKIYNYVDKKRVINLSLEKKINNQYDIFFIGRLTEQKDPIRFIEIISLLKEKNKKINAVMIGDGHLKEKCQDKIKELSLENNIEMVGFCSNPFPIIKNCKIGIMPSVWEGFGLTAIEAMCLNRPVFNSGVGGLGEIFENNQEYICNTNEDYVNKINNLLKEKEIVNNVNIDEFTDKEEWKDQIISLYRS